MLEVTRCAKLLDELVAAIPGALGFFELSGLEEFRAVVRSDWEDIVSRTCV